MNMEYKEYMKKELYKYPANYYKFDSKELKNLRTILQLSQYEMANLLGFKSRSYVCKMEKGKRQLSKHMSLLCNLVKYTRNIPKVSFFKDKKNKNNLNKER